MDREFGSGTGGCFATQIRYAAYDCAKGKDTLTRLWGKFFKAFRPVAFAIAGSEACNFGSDFPIMRCIQQMPEIKASIRAIESYLQEVIAGAVEESLKDE